jgi:3-oxoadipate enol-lactonase
MPQLELGPEDSLYYEFDPPASPAAVTFVFVNAITGDTGLWQARVGPLLREQGHGTLAWNFRGQPNSRFAPGTRLDDRLITADLQRLVAEVAPPRPVLVGLSIGGLYAARAVLGGTAAAGLVLLNTCREIGPRIAWMNDATARAMEVGGPNLMRDLMTPMLFGPDFLVANRAQFLKPDTVYQPMDTASGQYRLIALMGQSDWSIPYDRLDLPTLVVSGPNDRVFFEEAVVARQAALLPQGRRVDIPEAGHLLPAEVPDRLAGVLAEFAARDLAG